MADANERQVGGTHYKGGKIQHWDFVVAMRLDYLQGYSSKYIIRWRKLPPEKGRQDLEKCKHIVEKMLELARIGFDPTGLWKAHTYVNHGCATEFDVTEFARANDITAAADLTILNSIFCWQAPIHLVIAVQWLDKLLQDAS